MIYEIEALSDAELRMRLDRGVRDRYDDPALHDPASYRPDIDRRVVYAVFLLRILGLKLSKFSPQVMLDFMAALEARERPEEKRKR